MTNDYGNLELHTVLLAAMKDIDKICRENGLRYYIYAGTLLGAVNHKGFIPWDDDVDIVMMPEDFKVFCEIIDREYSERYSLQTFDRDPDWYSKMNKLLVKGTEIITQHGTSVHPIFIDICVLHTVPDKAWQRLLQRKQIEWINLVLSVQSGAIIPTSLVSKLTLGNLEKLNRNFWGRQLDRVMSRYDGKQTEYLGIMCNTLTRNPYTGRTGYETDFTKREWHENAIRIGFEDFDAMTFSNIEEYLTYQFGPRWAEPYPEEKRKSKHDVNTYRISSDVRKRVGL